MNTLKTCVTLLATCAISASFATENNIFQNKSWSWGQFGGSTQNFSDLQRHQNAIIPASSLNGSTNRLPLPPVPVAEQTPTWNQLPTGDGGGESNGTDTGYTGTGNVGTDWGGSWGDSDGNDVGGSNTPN